MGKNNLRVEDHGSFFFHLEGLREGDPPRGLTCLPVGLEAGLPCPEILSCNSPMELLEPSTVLDSSVPRLGNMHTMGGM